MWNFTPVVNTVAVQKQFCMAWGQEGFRDCLRVAKESAEQPVVQGFSMGVYQWIWLFGLVI